MNLKQLISHCTQERIFCTFADHNLENVESRHGSTSIKNSIGLWTEGKQRHVFIELTVQQLATCPNFYRKICDEPNIWRKRYVNMWTKARAFKTPQKSYSLVWILDWQGYRFIYICVCENNVEHSITVHGENYRLMVTNFFCHELDFLYKQFESMVITASKVFVNWPQRLWNKILLDLFLWGFLKPQ